MFCFSVFLIVLFCLTMGGRFPPFETNPICKLPRGNICVEINSCPYFADLLERSSIPRPLHVIRIFREHHCGFTGSTPKVCCNAIFEPPAAPKTVMEDVDEIPFVKNHENLDLLPRSCGIIPDDARITQGSNTSPMEFPWMALLAYYTDDGLDFHCAGTLLNERYVLTAAHCVVNHTIVGVRLGEYDISRETDCDKQSGICSPPVQDFYIEDIIPHPGYNRKTFANDIALVRLATSANLTYENTRPVCLPIGRHATTFLDGKYAVVTGWGVTEKGYKSEKLQKIQIPIVPSEHCRKIYKGRSPVTHKQLCAGGFLGRDSCGGDSGGPLMLSVAPTEEQATGPRFVQHGIVSYGPRHCGTEGQPGIYTKLVYYVRWVLDNMKPWDAD